MKKILIICLSVTMVLMEKLPNDVRWVTNSKEYIFLCKQVYKNATKELLSFLENKNDTNLAIIMDLDETVLDNSRYQIELFEKNQTFNMDSWSKWVLREEANLVPGAKEYIQFIRKNNIQLIFLSNRMNDRLEATKNNLKKMNIYSDDDIYLLRLDKKDKKYIRREEVYNSIGRMKKYKNFKIIQYLGDAAGDFPSLDDENIGKTQFIFPNPMYGKW